jgi:hypothetical protein
MDDFNTKERPRRRDMPQKNRASKTSGPEEQPYTAPYAARKWTSETAETTKASPSRDKRARDESVGEPPERGSLDLSTLRWEPHCDRCGKHMEELQTYGGPGDPCGVDLTGARLVKIYHPISPPPSDEEMDLLHRRSGGMAGSGNVVDKLAKEIGESAAKDLLNRYELAGIEDSVWLCRDCILFEENAHFATSFIDGRLLIRTQP